jgi:integrase
VPAISAAAIARATAGAVLRDSTIPGLAVRIGKRGAVWSLRYRTRAGVERRPKIGRYPAIDCDAARLVAREWLLEVARGGDPVVGLRAKVEKHTVEELKAKYVELRGPRKKAKSLALDESYWRSILAAWGKRDVRAISEEDVASFHAGMGDKPYFANRVLALVSNAFKVAERPLKWRDKGSNPAKGVERFPEHKRRRVPRPDELERIGKAMGEVEPFYPAPIAVLLLLMFTGGRKSEILRAEAEWISPLGLELPDSKTGAKIIPLSGAARLVIERLGVKSGPLFQFKDIRGAWELVKEKAEIENLRLHDLRRLFISAGLGEGYSLDALGQIAGHESIETTRGYAWLQMAPAQRAADATSAAIAGLIGHAAPTRDRNAPGPAGELAERPGETPASSRIIDAAE